jgi:hypothetical protein
MADSVLTNYTQSGPVVANGTVGTTINSIIIRSPADQRTALNVYSTEQANMLFLPVSAPTGSSATMASNINMSGNAITNLKAPLTTSDAANKAYVDSTTVSLAGDTMTGPLQMNNNAVTGLPAPQNSTDAASKNYVDTKFMVAAGPNNVTGVMQMNNNIIAGLPAPQNAGDAANKNYVDTTTVSLAGDTMTGDLRMNNNRITDLPNVPAASTDAVSKTYVDAAVAAGVASVSSGPGYLPLTGTGNNMLTGAINMGGNLINAVLAPVVATDAANKAYVDSVAASGTGSITGYLPLSGSAAMTGALNMGTKLINNVATPLTATDAATKAYVDTTAAGYVPLSGGTLTNAALVGASSTITGTLTCSGAGKITGVPTPSAASDAVPKSYADLLVAGLTFKPAVACYTTLATPFTSFVYNGGQQITINIVATPIDGYTLQLNDRVLVNCAGTQAANGVYLVTQLASPITLVRPTDLDGSPLSEFQQGGLFYVTNGIIFGGSLFVQSSVSPSVIGTSPIVYSQYAAAKNIAAGANVAITGNQVAVASTLTGITSMALSSGDGSAGVLTVGKASGADSYALALPSAAPASNTFLKYDGANYSWSAADSPLTDGSNINITNNAVGLNAAVSGLTSVGINGTSSSDALTLSKATGGAAYTLALPASAPAASTYLQYNGSAYTWAAASVAVPPRLSYTSRSGSAVYSPNYILTYNPSLSSAGYLKFMAGDNYSVFGGVPLQYNDTTFVLSAGVTYKISFSCDIICTSTPPNLPVSLSSTVIPDNRILIRKSDTVTLPTTYNTSIPYVGNFYSIPPLLSFKAICVGYITPTITNYFGIYYSGPVPTTYVNGLVSIDVL